MTKISSLKRPNTLRPSPWFVLWLPLENQLWQILWTLIDKYSASRRSQSVPADSLHRLAHKGAPNAHAGHLSAFTESLFCDRVTGDLTLRVRWSQISMNNRGFRIQQQNNLTAYCVIKQPASTCLYFKDNIPKNVLKQNPNRNIPFLSLGCLGWYQAQSIHFPTLLSLYAKQYHSCVHLWWKDIHIYVLWHLRTLIHDNIKGWLLLT